MPDIDSLTAGGSRAQLRGVRLSLRAADRPGDRTELFIAPDGALWGQRTTAGVAEERTGGVDGAVLGRLVSLLQTAPDGHAAPGLVRLSVNGLLPSGDATWGEGTDAPPAPALALLEQVVAQLFGDFAGGGLPGAAVQVDDPQEDPSAEPAAAYGDSAETKPSSSRVAAAFGRVGDQAAYVLAEEGKGFGLYAVRDQELLGSSSAEASAGALIPETVALGSFEGRGLLAAGDRRGALKVWDTTTGAALHGTAAAGGAQAVAAGTVRGVPLAFAAGRTGDVRAWRASDARPLGALSTALRGAAALCHARCADLDLLAAAGEDGVVRVWNIADGERLHLLVGHSERVAALAVLSLGNQAVLASGGADHDIRLWDLATGRPLAVLSGHAATVTGLAFLDLAGRPVLASCSLDGTVRTWDVREGRALHGWSARSGWLTSLVAVTLNGTPVLAVGDEHGSVGFWEAGSGTAAGALAAAPESPSGGLQEAATPVNSLAAADLEGTPVLVAGHGDGTVRVWDLAKGVLLRRLDADGGPVTSVAVTAGAVDAAAAAGGAANGTTNGTTAGGNEGDGGEAAGPVLVCGTASGTVRCHRLTDGELLSAPGAHTDRVTALTFAPSGVLVSGSADGTVRTWDPLDGTPLLRFAAHPGGVTAVAAGEDGGHALLATAGEDRTVRLWHGLRGIAGPVLTGASAPASALVFGALQGRAVVVAGTSDGSVAVWDVATGTSVSVLPGDGPAVRSLVHQELEGESLVAFGDQGGTLRLLHLASGTVLNEVGTGDVPLAVSFDDTGLHVVGAGGLSSF
ncbi:WD40 repeat domain-containing protein [Peterkaempfera griseoplana]|uniref:WD40 repeat domain-containing protein n=1 Tax=Peterkaempfera griseoplana TaxID=66896 RepID=UPI0006E3014A|nr:WD40 repeat domain-containing protein [Peterkaempfera griseoplana]